MAPIGKGVPISAVPIVLKSATNAEGIPSEVFDGLRMSLFNDRSRFYKDFAVQLPGANTEGARASQAVLDRFWLWSMQAG